MLRGKFFLVRFSFMTILFVFCQPSYADWPSYSCKNIHNLLFSCEQFKCIEFNPIYPLTFVKHEIWGLKEDKCQYHQITASTTMLCNYSLETRTKIVKLKDQIFQEYQEELQKTVTDHIMRDPTNQPLKNTLGLDSDELLADCTVTNTFDTNYYHNRYFYDPMVLKEK